MKYIPCILLCSKFMLFCTGNLSAQISDTSKTKLSPLFFKAFRKPLQTNPLLAERIKPSRHELMYWPNYSLTAQQIAERDRRRQQSVRDQIVGDIIVNAVNALIYGKKPVAAVKPHF